MNCCKRIFVRGSGWSNHFYSVVVILFLLILSVPGQSQTTLAFWGFDNNLNLSTDNAVGTPSVSVSGMDFSSRGECGGGSSKLYCDGSGDYVDITINTTGFYSITIEWYQLNWQSSAGSWHLYGSTDGSTNWQFSKEDNPGVSSTCGTVSVTLPSTFDNQSNVRLRFLSNVTSGATLYIDAISIEGVTCPAPGDPSVFGTNTWNVYSYQGNAIDLNNIEYYGYYTEPNFSFVTTDRWDLNGSPSDASGYQGCTIADNNHTFVHKRQGFPPGVYQISLSHDDGYQLYIDNSLVSSSNTWDSYNTVNVGGTYTLNSSSTIEFRVEENAGGSRGGLTFTTVCANPTDGGTIANAQSICEGDDPNIITSTSAASGETGTLEYKWRYSENSSGGPWTDITANSETYDLGVLTTTTWFQRLARANCLSDWVDAAESNVVEITVNPLPSVTANADKTIICAGESVTLNGSGATNYTWDNGVSNGVAFVPASTTTYTLTGSDNEGCSSTDQITIVVNEAISFTESNDTTICEGGSATIGVDVPFENKAAFFNDADPGNNVHTEITIPNSNQINTLTVQNRTVALWFKVSNVTNRQMLFEEGGNVNGFSIFVDNAQIHVHAWESSTSWGDVATPIVANKWYHVAFVYDSNNAGNAADPHFKGYLDGEYFGGSNGAGSGNGMSSHSGDNTIGASGGNLRYPDNNASNARNYTFGYINEFKLWNRSLTEAEIKAERYNRNDATESGANLIVYYNFANSDASDLASGGGTNNAIVNGDVSFVNIPFFKPTVGWNPGNTISDSITVSPTSTQTYNYEITDSLKGCAVTGSVDVNVVPAADAGTNGTLTICEGSTPSNAELFAALGGTPDVGGSWTNVGLVYTYTVSATSPCTTDATATVTLTEQAQPNAGTNGVLLGCVEAVTNAELFAALGGTPDVGGTWSGPVAGVYTYTVTSILPCTLNASATVTVQDNQDPVITCPANIVVSNDPDVCGAIVTYTPPLGTDNCAGATTVLTAGLGSGALFPVGITTETYTVTDAGGNSVSCSFTVTVTDNQLPSITKATPDTIIVNNTPGVCGRQVTFTDPSITDNCPSPILTRTSVEGSNSLFPIGVTPVTYEARDSEGNTSFDTIFVKVIDIEPPTIDTCPAEVFSTVYDTIVNIDVLLDAPIEPRDNCSGSSLLISPEDIDLSSAKVEPINIVATDLYGIEETCSFNINVNNTTPIQKNPDTRIVCVGSVVEFSYTGAWPGKSKWSVAGPDATIDDNSAQITDITFNAPGVYTVKAKIQDTGKPIFYNDWMVVVPGTTSPVSVTITANPTNTICDGDEVTFNATPTNGGTSPAYKWYRNGSEIAGEISSAYTTSSLIDGDEITCELTSSNVCVSNNPATSNAISMTVHPSFSSGEIESAGQTICLSEDPAEIGSLSAATGGDGVIDYQWRANGSIIAGANSASYNPPAGITTNTTFTRWAKDNSCSTGFEQSTGTWVVNVIDFTMTLSDESTHPNNGCPDLTDGFNPDNDSYDAGLTTLVFRVTRPTNTGAWSFDFTLAGANAGVDDLQLTGASLSSGNNTAGSIDAGTSTTVTFTYKINNDPGSQLDVQMLINNGTDGTCNDNTNKTVTHTIAVMPAVGNFN